MEYKEPKLHSLMNRSVSGDSRGCVDGSLAQFLGIDCTTGTGDEENECGPGAGAGFDCTPGTAASGCGAGNDVFNFCVSGGINVP